MIDIDTIGAIYTQGTHDAQGNTITAPVQIPGYYVNTTAPVGGWEAFKLTDNPANRVFGGTLTHSYKFTDIAEYEAYLATADLTAPSSPPTDIPVINNVPQSITRAQAKAALIINGLISLVQPALDAIVDPLERQLAQNDWDERLHFERTNPMLNNMAAALGMTDAQIDDLFRTASQL